MLGNCRAKRRKALMERMEEEEKRARMKRKENLEREMLRAAALMQPPPLKKGAGDFPERVKELFESLKVGWEEKKKEKKNVNGCIA